MKLSDKHKKIWQQVQEDLADEPVASPDHVERMTKWSQKLGRGKGADMDVLTAGALVHDIGVPIDRKHHYLVGRDRAREVFKQAGFPEKMHEGAIHVLEAHSRYGGPEPSTLEARIGQDADALEYIGAIGIIRAVVRGLTDGSFDGQIKGFPDFLRSILDKVEGTFHTEEAEKVGRDRIATMKSFLRRMEQELNFEA